MRANKPSKKHTDAWMEILTDKQRQRQSWKPLYRDSISVFPITQRHSQTERQPGEGGRAIINNDDGEERKRGDK